jgi:outer membrane protein assembly factor BamB
MRGKRMRCPNPICRSVFEVRDDNDEPALLSPAVEAKPVAEPIAKEWPPPSPPKPIEAMPTEAPAPPVVSQPVETKPVEATKPQPVKRKPIPIPVQPQPAPDFADDFPGDDEAAPVPTTPAIAAQAWQPEAWEAPPVREDVVSAPVREAIAPPLPTPAPVKRRRALWVIGAMALALGVVAAASYWRIRGSIETNETESFQRAEELYQEKRFSDASAALQKLHRDFPDSPHNKKYRFLAELSDVRQAVDLRESPEETKKAFERVLQLAGMYNGDPLLKERDTDLWQTLDFLARELTRLAAQEKAPALVPLAKRAWTEAKKYPPPAGTSQAERERTLEGEWMRIEVMLAAHLERQQLIATLKKHLEQTNAASVQEAWALLERTKRQDDAEIRALLDDLVRAHRDQVKFVPANSEAKLPTFDEDALPSLSVTPSVKAERAVASVQPLVLALARGVLYALEPAKGELRWARRVGIDTNVLPLRVPADAITPDLLLVVSSDQRCLSALVADTGAVLWQTPLSDACLGQPVLVDRQVLVPTLAGRIEEIEIAEGRLLGSYHVGQPLTLGGVRQSDTPFVYFPADEFCLYVFDISKRTCTNILYARHSAGSLRGLPAIVSGDKGAYLLWTQAMEGEGVEVKGYELPIGHHVQKPVAPTLAMPRMSAPPWCGADRLAVLTEKGDLSLWGLRQKGTRDPRLFRLMKDFLVDESKGRGRCQVVHADAENYWTLTRGNLQRVQSTFDPKQGPGLLTPWTHPIALGTLLHAAQARREPDGRTILYLTTQADEHPTCLTSAVDAHDGKILWQRQLGVMPQQAPIVVGDQILVRDAQGVMRFDAGKIGDTTEKRWQQAGEWLVQEAWTDAPRILLTRESSYVQLTLPHAGKKARIQVGQLAGDDKIRAFKVDLTAPPQGAPALGDGFLLWPSAEADGIIVRINLQDGSLAKDFNWRAVGAEDQARGHLVLLGPAECVVTDGSRGVARVVSIDGKSWIKRAEAKLSYRITVAPLILPAAENGKPRLCVADASDTLTLLESDRLTVLKRWTMPGKITAGPFVRAGKVGCVVGRNRLVWLDPNQDNPAWEYTFDADIVGEPHIIDGNLVVADVAGQFRALEPSSGGRLGPGLTLKANVAATAAPLPFGPGRAFAPLTDGTIVLVPLEKLRK